jgi:AraC family transcriptional regulator
LSPTSAERYRDRFRTVLDYIDAHLADDLSIECLSSVAAFSKYHFHRQFSALLGVGVYRYVQLARLKRASYQLAYRQQSAIVDIAFENGYGSPEAFARAFRKNIGQSPTEFRNEPQWGPWHAIYQPVKALRNRVMSAEYTLDQVKVVTFPETRVAALEYRGDVTRIGAAIHTFIEWRKQNRLPPKVSATFNVVYHHPAGADEGDCHYELCAATERGVAPNDSGVAEKVIPGGRCAVLRHTGSEDLLGESVSYVYSQWLPQSGEELRDFPLFFQRVRFFPDVPEHEAETDIFLPLK